MLIQDVKLDSPMLSTRDAAVLRMLLDKRTAYAEQGRAREAYGVSAALLIVWQAVTQPDIPLELPESAKMGL